MGRDAVLAAVDAALARVDVPSLPRLAAASAPGDATLAADRATLTARFSAEARAVGTIVHVVPTRAAAIAIVAALFRDLGARRIVTWPSAGYSVPSMVRASVIVVTASLTSSRSPDRTTAPLASCSSKRLARTR